MAARELDSHCGFDILFSQNVPHIMEKILFSLDYESFKSFLLVRDDWRDLILSESFMQKVKSVFSRERLADEEKLLRSSRGMEDLKLSRFTINRVFS